MITFRNKYLKCEGGGWFEIHCCKECSGNLIEICGYPDPQKTWHFDACESFVEFLAVQDSSIGDIVSQSVIKSDF